MAKSNNPSVTVFTKPFIISYPELMAPKPFKEGGDPQYSFEALSEPDDLKVWEMLNRETGDVREDSVEKVAVGLAKERWGDDFDVKAAVAHGGLHWPFKSGDKKAEEKGAKGEHYQGKKVWRAHAKNEINGRHNEPSLYEAASDGSITKLLRSTEDGKRRINDLFYGGAICTAELNVVAMETPQGKYITIYMNSVVFEKDGDRLGGGSNIERHRGVHGGETNYDPTTNMSPDLDDEIPF